MGNALRDHYRIKLLHILERESGRPYFKVSDDALADRRICKTMLLREIEEALEQMRQGPWAEWEAEWIRKRDRLVLLD